ncbi:MAG: GNAT family N-acetyltransferase [Proteobacteria bacterium]|nr:GNAT family N-acetyltransferase [Pseudomonadota bacterium]MDA0928517.1 GNAT family N-acetyltransferase [Pseudomonadota bacterium]
MTIKESILTTERLLLREATLEDAGFMLSLLSEPAWREFIVDHDVTDEIGARTYLQERILPGYREGRGLWLMQLRETSVPIGICGLVRRPFLEHTDLGFALLADYRAEGYAAEAARAVIDYARKQLGLQTLLAITVPHNTKSIQLLQRLGFSFSEQTTNPDGEALSLFRLELDGKRPTELNLL